MGVHPFLAGALTLENDLALPVGRATNAEALVLPLALLLVVCGGAQLIFNIVEIEAVATHVPRRNVVALLVLTVHVDVRINAVTAMVRQTTKCVLDWVHLRNRDCVQNFVRGQSFGGLLLGLLLANFLLD